MTNAGVCSGDEQSAHVMLFSITCLTALDHIDLFKEPHRVGKTDPVWSDH